MGNLKKGDIVEVVSHKGISDLGTIFIKVNHKYEVGYTKENTVFLCYPAGWIGINVNSVKKIGESQMKYEESKRYKLAQAVKEKVKSINSRDVYATAGILSLATGNSKTYFSSQSAKSKFLSRGDLSEKTYKAMLVDLAFAEREVLGIGAKTVETTEKDWLDEVIEETLLPYIKEKEKLRSNKPLFIGAVAVIFIALILFILNNYLQVV